jgi:hypothetical protein
MCLIIKVSFNFFSRLYSILKKNSLIVKGALVLWQLFILSVDPTLFRVLVFSFRQVFLMIDLLKHVSLMIEFWGVLTRRIEVFERHLGYGFYDKSAVEEIVREPICPSYYDHNIVGPRNQLFYERSSDADIDKLLVSSRNPVWDIPWLQKGSKGLYDLILVQQRELINLLNTSIFRDRPISVPTFEPFNPESLSRQPQHVSVWHQEGQRIEGPPNFLIPGGWFGFGRRPHELESLQEGSTQHPLIFGVQNSELFQDQLLTRSPLGERRGIPITSVYDVQTFVYRPTNEGLRVEIDIRQRRFFDLPPEVRGITNPISTYEQLLEKPYEQFRYGCIYDLASYISGVPTRIFYNPGLAGLYSIKECHMSHFI